MTAILGVFGGQGSLPGEPVIRRMLAASGGRAGEVVRTHHEQGAVLACSLAPAGEALTTSSLPAFAVDEDYVVVADASLYYIDDLGRAIGGSRERERGIAQLVLDAYRAFGDRCIEYLEGDFAFVVWHRRSGRAFCARDFAGRRSLYVAEVDGTVVVASSIPSILEHPAASAEPNLAVVGAEAASLIFAMDDETAFRGVRAVRAGWTLVISKGTVRTSRYWQPEVDERRAGAREFERGAEELRGLLIDAVRERMDDRGPTTVWLSGGRDSTAVFGAGQQAIRAGGARGPLLAVSRSDPVGDVGREDDVIGEVAAFWGVSPRWVDAGSVPMFTDVAARARSRPQPFAQPFENITRALAEGTRSLGARVALDGYGGDFLFQVSQIFLADLVARGRVAKALREWRAMDRMQQGWKGFAHWGVLPVLPAWARRAIAAARGRPEHVQMQRTAPPWIDARFVREHALVERSVALGVDAQAGASRSARETAFYFTHPQFARINAMMGEFALEHGVELRSPLLDRRVVRFALSRPREERNLGGDRKRLVRHAMRDLLPECAVRPRPFKTGTLASYFAREMQCGGVKVMEELRGRSALADAGIVDRAALDRAIEAFKASPNTFLNREALFCTLQAELWLRSRANEPATVAGSSSWNGVGEPVQGFGAHV